MTQRAAPIFLAALAAALLAACGADEPGVDSAMPAADNPSREYRSERYRYTVSLPAGWQRARRPITPELMVPREIFSAGTFTLRFRPTNCEAWAGAAQEDLGAQDAFITVREAGDSPDEADYDYGPRPETFSAWKPSARPTSCPQSVALVQHIRFHDSGRSFDVLVVTGPETSAETRRAAYRVLDSFRVEPMPADRRLPPSPD